MVKFSTYSIYGILCRMGVGGVDASLGITILYMGTHLIYCSGVVMVEGGIVDCDCLPALSLSRWTGLYST